MSALCNAAEQSNRKTGNPQMKQGQALASVGTVIEDEKTREY